ncbi:MAG: histidinol dehydrogenase, partial [Polymorphobacter sp.]
MQRLDARGPGFDAAFTALVEARRESDAGVATDVAAIIANVRSRGDAALFELTVKFDRIDLAVTGIEVSGSEIAAARRQVAPETLAALELAAARIRAFHAAQRPADHDATDALGVRAGYRWSAAEAAGLYVPGGLASYPSSVLLNASPAKVAGVERLVMVTPTPGGRLNPLVLVAAELAG